MMSTRLCKVASALSVAAAALLSSGCERSFDVTWTVQGKPASEGCAGLGERVRLTSEWRDSADAPPRRFEIEAACADGTARINAGQDARLIVDLLRDDAVVGSSTPVTLGARATSPVEVDLALHTGQLAATLTIDHRSCGEAGVNRLSVTLLADSGLSGRKVDEKEVTCEDGVAVYRHPAVKLGTRYFVDATATVGDERYEVAGPGVAVRIDKPRTTATVNLDRVARQPGRDAGGVSFVDGGSGEGEGEDGGEAPVDAGSDAGGNDAEDAGTDAGGDDPVDAGSDAGGDDPVDAGYDAGDDDPVDAGYDAGDDDPVDAGYDAGDDDAEDAGHDAGSDDAGDTDAGE